MTRSVRPGDRIIVAGKDVGCAERREIGKKRAPIDADCLLRSACFQAGHPWNAELSRAVECLAERNRAGKMATVEEVRSPHETLAIGNRLGRRVCLRAIVKRLEVEREELWIVV